LVGVSSWTSSYQRSFSEVPAPALPAGESFPTARNSDGKALIAGADWKITISERRPASEIAWQGLENGRLKREYEEDEKQPFLFLLENLFSFVCNELGLISIRDSVSIRNAELAAEEAFLWRLILQSRSGEAGKQGGSVQ
jgi:hypothetical protein